MSEKQSLINSIIDKNTKKEFSLAGVPLTLDKRDIFKENTKKKSDNEGPCSK
jgi:hypothetical protein